MVLYRIGEIVYKNQQNFIFESQGVGFSLNVPNNERFENNQRLKMYIFELKNDYYEVTYGFKDFKERLLFIDLISLNGIGPKVAFNILNIGWEKAAQLIALGNAEGLKQVPYLSPKNIRNIILELQEKWMRMLNLDKDKDKLTNVNHPSFNEIKDTLKMLGFKNNQINYAIAKINTNQEMEAMIEEAIKIMANYKNEQVNS